MTLPEVLVSVLVIGSIAAVLSAAITVTFRQQDNTEGRLNVARAEQNVGMWIPADLASADTVDTSPAATPCGASVCAGIDLSTGSNALMPTWTAEGVTTNVAYYFLPSSDGQSFELVRIECVGGACSAIVLLRDLPGPPAGQPFEPGVTRPDWVILVSEPLAPDAISEDDVADESERKDANRVVVTINGGGDVDGSGGGINQISITAGGTVRKEIPARSVQGAPSFVEARSRCGGPMVLVVDESNSIGSAITNVREGVRRFIESLAGTPVQLQVVRLKTTSSILGDGGWTRYFDMTNEADVATLLGAVPGLQGSGWGGEGGTNWEDALFRTFRNPDASTAPIVPETVVFFTDGVPTFDRLVHRGAPGVLSAEPPDPGLPWPDSNGSVYSQVAFNRANYIATAFRSSVRLIGVGVGGGITGQSDWIVDPGAGYRLEWERGSYSHVRTATTYQARYQVRNSGSSTWWFVPKNTYDSWSSSRRRDVGWTNIPEAEYLALENPPDSYSGDGLRWFTTSTPISTAVYQADATNPAFQVVPKTWANGPDWEPWVGSRPGDSSHYRSTQVFNSPPYDGYLPAVTAKTNNAVILARLIAGNDNGTPAIWDGTSYTNAEIADMYVLPNWSQFTTAMEAVALGECGGTLTLQTKIGGTSPAPDPFRYQNNAVTDSSGAPVELEKSVVTTNQQFITGTFDFAIPNGQYVTVDILPQNFSELTAYMPGAWSCRAGVTERSFETVPIDGTTWTGVRVQVAANEAVACTLSVNHT